MYYTSQNIRRVWSPHYLVARPWISSDPLRITKYGYLSQNHTFKRIYLFWIFTTPFYIFWRCYCNRSSTGPAWRKTTIARRIVRRFSLYFREIIHTVQWNINVFFIQRDDWFSSSWSRLPRGSPNKRQPGSGPPLISWEEHVPVGSTFISWLMYYTRMCCARMVHFYAYLREPPRTCFRHKPGAKYEGCMSPRIGIQWKARSFDKWVKTLLGVW